MARVRCRITDALRAIKQKKDADEAVWILTPGHEKEWLEVALAKVKKLKRKTAKEILYTFRPAVRLHPIIRFRLNQQLQTMTRHGGAPKAQRMLNGMFQDLVKPNCGEGMRPTRASYQSPRKNLSCPQCVGCNNVGEIPTSTQVWPQQALQ